MRVLAPEAGCGQFPARSWSSWRWEKVIWLGISDSVLTLGELGSRRHRTRQAVLAATRLIGPASGAWLVSLQPVSASQAVASSTL